MTREETQFPRDVKGLYLKERAHHRFNFVKRTRDLGPYSHGIIVFEHEPKLSTLLNLTYYEDFDVYPNSYNRVTSRAEDLTDITWSLTTSFTGVPGVFEDILVWIYHSIRPVRGTLSAVDIEQYIYFILKVGIFLGEYKEKQLFEISAILDKAAKNGGRGSEAFGDAVGEQLERCGTLPYRQFGPYLGYGNKYNMGGLSYDQRRSSKLCK